MQSRSRGLLLAVVVLLAGCGGPAATPGASPSPTPTASPTATPTPTPTTAPTPTPTPRTRPTAKPGTPANGTATSTRPPKGTPAPEDVRVSVTNRDESRTYVAFAAVVSGSFDAQVRYADGSTATFENVTARELRRENNDSRVTDVTFEGATARSALVRAESGATASTTLDDAPGDGTLLYFVHTEPFDPTRSLDGVAVCQGSDSFDPVRFEFEDGSSQVSTGCLTGTPGR